MTNNSNFLTRAARALCLVLVFLLGFEPVVWAAPTITYLHNDAAGSPVAATDELGAVVWRESYRPYGDRVKNEAAASSNRQFFHGKPLDTDSGLSYFGARYYDPVVGRFMGVDPVGFSEENFHSFNRYAYGNNNPLKYRDPDGRLSILAVAFWGTVLYIGAVIYAGRKGGGSSVDPLGEPTRSEKTFRNPLHNDNANTDAGQDGRSKAGSVDQPPVPGAAPGTETKGRSKQWDKPGGMSDADKDFDSKGPRDIVPLPDGGRRGTLPDGRPINVRPNSTDGRPTLEIQDGKNKIKVRYGPAST
ncbi:MAG: repeat-associated core protein [Rhodocyclales bacterium]|nr:repeat-associated core protein [Rhodocyclales bacterium]